MKIQYINCLITFGILAGCQSASDQRKVEAGISSKSLGVISSAHPIATKAGLKILADGGNAFDAAVTVAATLNVVEPMMSGVGGYGTILIYDAKKHEVRFLDSSGKIPELTNSDLMRPPTHGYMENRRGAKAVSTPGNVNAWYAMSSEYGTLDWATLFEEPISLSKTGFPISDNLASSIYSGFLSFSAYSKSFYSKNGEPLQVGDTLKQPDLSRTFREIAEGGPAAFYKGDAGVAIDKIMIETGGFLRFGDLADDKAEWWEPIMINYRNYQVYTSSPPSTAFPSLIRLGIMSQFSGLEHNSAKYLHYFGEATKKAYSDRLTFAGDPEIKPPPLNQLLSTDYWKQVAASFYPDQAMEFTMPDSNTIESTNTTHFVVADKWGNIVSATQTLGNLFGSRIMPEGTGFWLNNSLAYCTYEPKGNPMDAIPGQRKLSGDCPTIIFKEGKPWVALGTPGGHTIGQTVPQMVMNLIDYNMSLADAINAPKVSFLEPSSYGIEYGIAEETFQELLMMGHDVRRVKRLGNAHALMIHYDANNIPLEFQGAADKRGGGLAEVLIVDN